VENFVCAVQNTMLGDWKKEDAERTNRHGGEMPKMGGVNQLGPERGPMKTLPPKRVNWPNDGEGGLGGKKPGRE